VSGSVADATVRVSGLPVCTVARTAV
jgi:hypothetical protein